MPRHIAPHPLFGFLCAGCGRPLEELPAWQLGKERFYCGVICKEADEKMLAQERKEKRRQASRAPG
jgi:predicted Fe-S protein YdhL (DUF1289 family)